ncbi:hypothetical protein R1flu_000388 [Riccia fluitans]|uniref:Uncharacterized protein n=1 Tax=Riccia fluitans TaxID=41844 RepID=A0ABD1Y0B6_9MARC
MSTKHGWKSSTSEAPRGELDEIDGAPRTRSNGRGHGPEPTEPRVWIADVANPTHGLGWIRGKGKAAGK